MWQFSSHVDVVSAMKLTMSAARGRRLQNAQGDMFDHHAAMRGEMAPDDMAPAC